MRTGKSHSPRCLLLLLIQIHLLLEPALPSHLRGERGGEKGYFVILLPGRDSQKWYSHNKMVNNWQLLCVCASFRGRISRAGCYLRTTPIHRRSHTHLISTRTLLELANLAFLYFCVDFLHFFAPPPHTLSSTAQDTQLVHHLTYSRNVLGTYLLMDT